MDVRDRELVLEFKNRLLQDEVKHVKRLIVFGLKADEVMPKFRKFIADSTLAAHRVVDCKRWAW